MYVIVTCIIFYSFSTFQIPHCYLRDRNNGKISAIFDKEEIFYDFLFCWSLTTRQPLWVILCRFPEKGRREIEEIAEKMKERDRGKDENERK